MKNKEKRTGEGSDHVVTVENPPSQVVTVFPKGMNLLDLDPFAFRLLYHYYSAFQATGKAVYQGTRYLAQVCNMSRGSVTNAKRTLEEAGLLRFVKRGSRETNEADEVVIPDLWKAIKERESTCPPDGQGVATCPRGEQVSVTCPPNGRNKKTSIINNTCAEPPATASALPADSERTATPQTLFCVSPKRKARGTRQRTPKVAIPANLFPWVYRVCYAADTPQKVKLLTQPQRGRVAQTLAVMYDAGIDVSRDLNRFETWWRINWRSKDGSRPRPEQVREFWAEAMDTVPEERAAPAPRSQADDDELERSRKLMQERAIGNVKAKR